MKNEPDETPLTSAEYFTLMRLFQTLEDTNQLPDAGVDWQQLPNKLCGGCLVARRNNKQANS